MDEQKLILEATYAILDGLCEAMPPASKADVVKAAVGIKLPSKEIAEGVLAKLREGVSQLRLRLRIDMAVTEFEGDTVYEFTFQR